MGTSQAGIVFKSKLSQKDIEKSISKLSGRELIKLPHGGMTGFDVRKHDCFCVERFDDIVFVSNHNLAWDFLTGENKDFIQIHEAFGEPEFAIIFCHYDSGGSHGYAFVENGKIVRSRLHTTGSAKCPENIEFGATKKCEEAWLNASFYYEDEDEKYKAYYLGNRERVVSEEYLNSAILHDALMEYFGVCAWTTSDIPETYLYKISDRKRSKWKFW